MEFFNEKLIFGLETEDEIPIKTVLDDLKLDFDPENLSDASRELIGKWEKEQNQ